MWLDDRVSASGLSSGWQADGSRLDPDAFPEPNAAINETLSGLLEYRPPERGRYAGAYTRVPHAIHYYMGQLFLLQLLTSITHVWSSPEPPIRFCHVYLYPFRSVLYIEHVWIIASYTHFSFLAWCRDDLKSPRLSRFHHWSGSPLESILTAHPPSRFTFRPSSWDGWAAATFRHLGIWPTTTTS